MMRKNSRFILNIMSDSLMIYGAALLPSVVAGTLCGETAEMRVILAVAVICFAAGYAGKIVSGRLDVQVRPRIWYMTTLFTWLLLVAVTVPVFYLGVPGHSIADAVFGASASWTATGISVYDFSGLPVSLRLVHSTCNWLGGVGMIMTVLSLVPTRQYLGYGLVSTEFPGPSFLKSGQPFRKGYRDVVLIYIILTLLQFMMLMITGMPLSDSVLTSLSNISTAGLQHLNNGVITGLPYVAKVIISIFSFLGSVNCTLLLLIMHRNFSELARSSEIKLYIGRILATGMVIALVAAPHAHGRTALRIFGDVMMQVISFISTSGYMIADTEGWPQFCSILLFAEMFIGACAVSTGGGIKEARLIIVIKSISYTIYRHIHPAIVRSLTFNKKPMTSDQIMRANLFPVIFMTTFLMGALLLSADDMSVYEALGYSQAALTGAGRYAGMNGPGLLPADFSALSKCVMSLLMVAGRLEIYPFIMVCMRSFWKSDRVI